MNEEMLLGLIIAKAVVQKCKVMLGNALDASTVACQCRTASVLVPKLKITLLVVSKESLVHHQFMIADQGNEAASANKVNENLEYTSRIHATINVISHTNNDVIGFRFNFVDQALKCDCTTVDIADGYSSRHFLERQPLGLRSFNDKARLQPYKVDTLGLDVSEVFIVVQGI